MGSPTSGRVLIVDDEWIVAKTLKEIFVRAGFETRTAASAEEALLLLHGADGWTPKFALLDVNLPGMNGLDLSMLLKRQFPLCSVMLFSGDAYTSELLDVARHQGETFEVIPKPVPPDVLLQRARLALQTGEHAGAMLQVFES